MLRFWKQFFTWWNGSTIGTRFFTWCNGKCVGEDQFGNIYYEGSTDKDGNPRRWVIYKHYSEASMIPPGWHGWIHHRTDTLPSQENYKPYKWEKPYQQNLTASNAAYTPGGSISHSGKRPCVTGDYDAWLPEN
ncbi:MAG: NADH:ubiquinone oxidoreductase [Candidatus Tokpelaia sp. JSC188]|nr:MAG: NADH:ubiquinone oxidoreductase [Candidatus Tokpelaia sp. JSC188]